MTTPEEMLAQNASGGAAAKWPNVGDVVAGKVTAVAVVDNPFEEEGTQQLRISILKDSGEDASIYVKAGSMSTAILEASKAHGQAMPAVGDTLAVQYAADGVASQAGWNAPKQYVAKLTPAGAAVLSEGAAPAPAALI